MRQKQKVKSVGMAILLTFFLSTIHAQESINATGGNASGSGGSTSYSVGQIAYQTHAETSGSVAEGVQQPYEISAVTGLEEAQGINLFVSAYPNPATNFLQLKVESEKLKDLSYQLYDINGNLLQSKKITGTRTQINMNGLATASYFVKVLQKNKEVKTFKIIKN